MADRPQIAIVDYQAGNLRSVQKALEKTGASAVATSDPEVITQADGVVFPGQGACDSSMRHIRELGLETPIKESIAGGKPSLGVCLGLQLLLEQSEEGDGPCLGILKGRVRKLPGGQKIPHMGWNQVDIRLPHPVLKGIPTGSNFYFVHSYYADPEDTSVVAGTTDYGINFCSAVAWDNVTAVQFHPEKRGSVGLIIYENFVKFVEQTKAAGVWR